LDFLQTYECHIDIGKGVLKYRFPLKFERKLCCSRGRIKLAQQKVGRKNDQETYIAVTRVSSVQDTTDHRQTISQTCHFLDGTMQGHGKAWGFDIVGQLWATGAKTSHRIRPCHQ